MSNEIDIGIRLKNLRTERKISQRQLAIKSGISNATISLVENNKTNPSLGLLKQILDVIPISIGDFFTMDVKQENKIVHRADELTEIGSGSISYLQVGNNLNNHQLQMMLERYQPGADTGKSMLSHESEESGLVLQGRLELTVGDEVYVLNKGDAYLFDSNFPHRFRNTGREECVVVSACTPPTF